MTFENVYNLSYNSFISYPIQITFENVCNLSYNSFISYPIQITFENVYNLSYNSFISYPVQMTFVAEVFILCMLMAIQNICLEDRGTVISEKNKESNTVDPRQLVSDPLLMVYSE
jgi:hypothetical protein